MLHFLIHPDGQQWRWTLYGGRAGPLASSACAFADRATCEAAVRLIQRSVRMAGLRYAGAYDED
jgi:hypothetical protein